MMVEEEILEEDSIVDDLLSEDTLTTEDVYAIKEGIDDVNNGRVVESQIMWKAIDNWFISDRMVDLNKMVEKLFEK